MEGIGVIIILLLDFFLSLWNAYASGYNSVALTHYKGKGKDLFNISNSFGVVIAFAGSTYVMAIFLSWILSSFHYISNNVVQLILTYNFLVFGGLLLFAGIVITIESIVVAYIRRDFMSVLASIWNVIVSAWNIYVYVSSFRYAIDIAKNLGSDEDNKNNAIIILLIAAVISLFLTYAFYKIGKKKAEKDIGEVPY